MFPLSSRLFLSSFFLFFLLRNETTSAKKPPLPSILFILVDDLGAADVSFNALLQHDGKIEPTIATPNIDRLADRGIRLKKYYTHPVCGPTRCSLISGRTATSMGNPFPTIFGGGFAFLFLFFFFLFLFLFFLLFFLSLLFLNFVNFVLLVLKLALVPLRQN